MKDATFAEKALSFLTLLTIFATPLALFSGRLYPFISSKSFFFMGFAELTFFLWAYLAITDDRYRLSRKQVLVLLLPMLLMVSLTVSAIFAPVPNIAFWGTFERATGLIFLYHCLVFGIVIASLVRFHGKDFLYKICRTVFYSGIIIALSTFINEHLINIPSLFLFDGPNSGDLFGNSSFSGAYLIFSLFLGAVFLLGKSDRKSKIWITIGLIAILVSPVAVMARGSIGGILIGAIVAFGIYLATHVRQTIKILGFSLLGLILAGGVVIGAALLRPDSKVHNAFAEAATNSRFIFWEAAVDGIKDRPVFGWGSENYVVAFTKHFNPKLLEIPGVPEIWTDKPHNSVLEAFVIGGFVGGILYLVFLISLLFLPIYLYHKKIFDRITLGLFIGMFVAYILQALILFDMVHTWTLLFVMFGLFVGLAFGSSGSTSSKGASDNKNFAIVALCLAAFVFCWISFVHNPLKKSKAIISSLSVGVDRQVKFAELIQISPMGNGGDVGYLASVMMSAYREHASKIMNSPEMIKTTQKEIHDFLNTVDSLEGVAGNHARLWLVSAELLNFEMTITDEITKDKVDRVLKYLERAEKLAPNNPRVYWTYGQVYLHDDNFKKSYEYYKKAHDINPKVVQSQNYLNRFEELFGNKI